MTLASRAQAALFGTPATPVGAGEAPAGARHLSLRRALVALILVALLPIMVLSILQGLVRIENRRVAEISQISSSANTLADTNKMILGTTETLLRSLAANPAVRAGGAGCAGTLADLRAATPLYANLAAYDRDGWLRCAAVGPGLPYVVSDKGWWNRVARARGVLVSDAVHGPLTGDRVVLVALPARDVAGTFDGAVVASIDLAWLDRKLRAMVTRPDTAVAVISDSGQVLMASRPIPPVDLSVRAGSIARRTDAAGHAWSYTVVPLVARGPDQHGLFVVYAAPDPPRFGLAWWQTLVDFLLPVLAIVMASLAIWYGSQQLVLRWLAGLQRLAFNFAAGDYRYRAVSFARAPREIRGVAASLYRMASAIAERDRRLRQSLEHQKKLAREVHHRVKNNFQVVMSLLSLQSSRLGEGSAREAIDQARRRIGALALVHRLIYDTGELASISSRTLLGALCEQLTPPPDPVRHLQLSCSFDDVPLDIDSAVPLTLWLVETVHNALTHGFAGRSEGMVTTHFRIHDGQATLIVSDDGVGFDAAAPAGGPGTHGLRLVRALAAQLGGSAEVTAGEAGGSVATLRFPLRAVAAPLLPESE
ncbi:hypothetical protein IP88_13950 [alpha proteobacterium AAP81b]|nr:hypothetical protein IP88_13950 [alpha proteobacterium AAP81b]